MISLQTLSTPPLPAWRSPLKDARSSTPARGAVSATGLPSLSEMRDSQKAMKKEMAARKVQAVRERRDALMLIVKIDPKAALKMTVEMAKDLRDAVKDYVDAGGRNVTDGEMATINREAKQTRETADGALESVPVPPSSVEVADVEAVDPPLDVDMKRAQAAYATAFAIADGRDETADRAQAIQGAANADQGFFLQVKLAMGELKEARDKIKADWANPKSPDSDDWKVADKAMAELEKAIDFAPTGASDMSDAPQVISA